MDNATHNVLEAYKLILENGGKAHAKGSENCNTLLDYHSKKGNFEIVKILVEHGARITENTIKLCSEDTSLYCLIDHADEDMVDESLESLINNDEKPSGFLYYMKNHSLENLTTYGILSCLSKSLQVKNESVCIYILKYALKREDYKVDEFTDEYDHWLINSVEMNSPECVRLLLDFMEKIKFIEDYFTPRIIHLKQYYGPQSRDAIIPDYYLHAAKLNNTEIIKILIEHKVPRTQKSKESLKNALFWAAVRQNAEIIHLLLEYGYERLDIAEEDLALFHIQPDFIKLISK
ncbi:hypothetical protein TVAG_439400 [Trichomonas vaginalis G3]|uniref:Ankyrin repeat protein n=1 Tax=Trichomonas vaginalis (strain ATCC PRA-98 / G3) TaxID=412133 RepID=A2FAF9_TRIV3|nr:hypothetical protein TVAGG3_0911530 [Trichomonas vaginalis G3]EAX98096.1 hypothetical protein TVAG_439400 [Trichomonas vaginalis G3]KAI5484464.1 hypothetical protein TVAGG3_0911530 [Trichomonas vaginalis G3]|eukprot:XP_001311026.1 hypothetical protein [Trichomonas vaginalis G3]